MALETRIGDLLTFKTSKGQSLAFHPRSLSLARLPDVAEEAVQFDLDLKEELLAWEKSEDPEVKDQFPGKIVRPNGIFKERRLVLNVTQVCNLACKYCFAGGDGTYNDPLARVSIEATIPSLIQLTQDLNKGDRFHLNFLGGEPLLYPKGIEAISEFLLKLSEEQGFELSLSMVTNGTLLTSPNLDLIQKYQISLIISLDGPPEVQDVVRPSKDKKAKSSQILSSINEIGERKRRGRFPSVTVSGVFNLANPNLIRAWEFYQKLPVDRFYFEVDYFSSGSFRSQALIQLQQIGERALALGGEAELRRIANYDDLFSQLESRQRIHHHCGAGVSLFASDARQNLYSCPSLMGQKKEVIGQAGVVNPAARSIYSENLIEANDCGTCWARHICGGGCMFVNQAHTGKKNQKTDHFCSYKKGITQQGLGLYFEVLNERIQADEAKNKTKEKTKEGQDYEKGDDQRRAYAI